jgi:hypothetical protein
MAFVTGNIYKGAVLVCFFQAVEFGSLDIDAVEDLPK